MKPNEFKAIRLSMNLSQFDLGEKLQKTERTIRRYEKGELKIPYLVENFLTKKDI